MSFNAVTCQNYFFRSPLVLFSAVLRIRLTLVCCVTIFVLWIQGETTHFLQSVFYYVPLGQTLLLPSKRKWHGFLLSWGLWLQSLGLSPGIDSHLQVSSRDFKYIPEAWACCSSFSVTAIANHCWSAAFKVVFCTLQPGFEFFGYKCSWSMLVLFLPGCGKCLQALCKAVLKYSSTWASLRNLSALGRSPSRPHVIKRLKPVILLVSNCFWVETGRLLSPNKYSAKIPSPNQNCTLLQLF